MAKPKAKGRATSVKAGQTSNSRPATGDDLTHRLGVTGFNRSLPKGWRAGEFPSEPLPIDDFIKQLLQRSRKPFARTTEDLRRLLEDDNRRHLSRRDAWAQAAGQSCYIKYCLLTGLALANIFKKTSEKEKRCLVEFWVSVLC